MQIRLKPLPLAIVVVVLLFGGIAVSDGLGLWITKSTKIPAKYVSGEFAGSYNPADIRGSYSFADVSENFEVPLEALAKAFDLKEDENAAAFQCKELESRYETAAEKGLEIDTDSIRVFVALYKGLPMELADTYLPLSAVEVLKDNANLSKEQMEYLNTHTVDLSKPAASEAVSGPAPANPEAPVSTDPQVTSTVNTNNTQQDNTPKNQESQAKNTDEDSGEKLVKGKTTFREILDWGVSKEEIEQVIGRSMPNATFAIKDFCAQQGIEFSSIKTKLQKIIDSK